MKRLYSKRYFLIQSAQADFVCVGAILIAQTLINRSTMLRENVAMLRQYREFYRSLNPAK